MSQSYTVQEAAKRTGLSPHTLRYYEKQDLIDGVTRTPGGARRYDEDAIGRLVFLTKMRATGMRIRDLKEYVRLVRNGLDNYDRLAKILQGHRGRIVAQLQELETNLQLVDLKLEMYTKGICPSDLNDPCARKIREVLESASLKTSQPDKTKSA